MIKKLFLTLSLTIIAIFGAVNVAAASNLDMAHVAVDMLNDLREDKGLNQLKWNPSSKLQRAAEVRAKEITEEFSHTRPDGSTCFTVLKEFGLSYSTCGENIAMGTQMSPQKAMEMWTNSPGHYKNMVNPDFEEIGLARYKIGDTIYWVQLFYTGR